MREVKFRAWSEYSNKLVVWEHMKADDTLGGVLNGDDKKIHVMQYTGLKDKNGREIYEGDILRVWQEDEYVPNRDSGGGIIDYDCVGGFSQIGKVGFTGCSFDYSTVKTLSGKHEEIQAPIDWIVNYEVIGNIYENPKLLEGETK